MRLIDLHDHAFNAAAMLPCGPDPDLWFADRPVDIERAKSLCHACPVREDCLAGAAERRERFGVWGGELFVEGHAVPGKWRRRSR